MTAHTAAPTTRRRPRWRFFLPPLALVAALVGGAGAQATPEKSAAARPAAELPATGSPINFHLSDEPAHWYDTGLTELEPVLHTRSLGVAVAGAPTKIKFSIAEPYTSENHTVSSIVWPEEA